MQPMCHDTTGVFQGWAIGVADCDGATTFEYYDEDFVSQGTTLPTNWTTCVQGEAGPAWEPTQSALVYATPVDIDFSDDEWYRTLSINGNLTFTGSSYQAATELNIRITETGGAVRTLTFPSGWIWYTSKPSTLAANKSGLLNLISYGTTEGNVAARYWVQTP